MKPCRIPLFIVISCLALSLVKPWAKAEEHSVRLDLLALSRSEAEREAPLKRLKALPVAEISRALRDLLGEPSSQAFAIRAIQVLEIKTFNTEVRSLAKRSLSFEVIDQLNSSLTKSDPEVIKIYLQRLRSFAGSSKSAPLKSAFLSGLTRMGESLPADEFEAYLQDPDYLVRESVIRSFLATRVKLSRAVQVTRFRASFKIRPFQARLLAYQGFSELTRRERRELAASFDEKNCESEMNTEVKAICQRLARSGHAAELRDFFLAPSFARADVGQERYKRNLYYWQEAQESVRGIGSQCMDCALFSAGKSQAPIVPKACKEKWDRFYDKPTIDIRVLLGYMDFGQSVVDFRAAQSMIEILTDGCAPGENLCGFRRDPDDRRYFTKPIVVDGKKKLVRLQVAWSSLSDNDDENTGRKGPHPERQKEDQDRFSSRVEEHFLDSLGSADATFYFGHSRFGAGPDFRPPRRAANGERDNAYYKNPENHEVKERMLDTLRSNARTTKILGLFGCDANTHFGEELRKVAPKMALIATTGLAYPESSTAQLYGALDSVLGRRCEKEFDEASNSLKTIQVKVPSKGKALEAKERQEDIPVPPVRLSNFF